MALRIQKPGNKKSWTTEEIKAGFEHFYNKYNRYPTAHEIDAYPHMPSSRSIQRQRGGLVALRKKLGLKGPQDFTKGEYSRERAKMINKRAHQLEKDVYDFLVQKFGKVSVHREYFFTDDRRTRTDFFIYCENGNFSVDVFYPKDKKNLIGCLNSKMRTYGQGATLQYPVIFLMMNKNITQEDVALYIQRKKNKLQPYQQVMTFTELQRFCELKIAQT